MYKSVNTIIVFLVILLLTGCQKEEIFNHNHSDLQTDNESIPNLQQDLDPKSGLSLTQEKAFSSADRLSKKVRICHKGGKVLSINRSALAAHIAHGDLILEDADGDGFYPDNECGYGPMGDCDDTDPNINPAAGEICDDGIDNNCNGAIDENDEECQTTVIFKYTSNFDDLNELGLGVDKGCSPIVRDFGNGYFAGEDGSAGLVSLGSQCTNLGRDVHLLGLAKLSFDLSAICDGCDQNESISEFSIDIINDYGNTKVITIRVDMANDTWNYNSGNPETLSYNDPRVITSAASKIEITDIPAGWTSVQVHLSVDRSGTIGSKWAIDNLVFENM